MSANRLCRFATYDSLSRHKITFSAELWVVNTKKIKTQQETKIITKCLISCQCCAWPFNCTFNRKLKAKVHILSSVIGAVRCSCIWLVVASCTSNGSATVSCSWLDHTDLPDKMKTTASLNLSASEDPMNFTINITFIDEFRTTPDLPLWSYIVFTIFFGLLFNLSIVRSILRTKRNG